MRFANSADWKSNLGKHYQTPSSSANAPEIVALADLGSQSATQSQSGNSSGWASYWDPFLKDIGKKSENKTTDPVDPVEPTDPTDPVDTKTDGRKFMEKLYKRQLDEGLSLEAAMKYNPATTGEDWARAFGKCRTTTSSDKHESIPSDCYWPEESGLEGSDFYSVGKGGGTAHAKRGQAAARAKAAAGRAKRKGATRSGGGVGNGGG